MKSIKGWAIVEPITQYPLVHTWRVTKIICENDFLRDRRDWEGSVLTAWKKLKANGYRSARFELREIKQTKAPPVNDNKEKVSDIGLDGSEA